MDTVSKSPAGKGIKRDESSTLQQTRNGGCCDIDFRIDARGDVNIYNCPQTGGPEPSPPEPPACPEGFPPIGACLPGVPGAKHKLGRDYKLTKRAERARVPSAIAAGALHMMRRFLLGKSAANPLELAAFSTLGLMPRDILSCTVAAFDALPPRQRNRLFAPSLLLDPGQPLDEAALTAALRQEILQRIGILIFDDPKARDQERPGRVRVYEPQGEDFFSQVRICAINDLRTANLHPADRRRLPPACGDPARLPDQHRRWTAAGGCQVRSCGLPGHIRSGPVCARVRPGRRPGRRRRSTGGELLQRRCEGTLDRSAERDRRARCRCARVGGRRHARDGGVNGEHVLINDCRVHDRLTFRVPDDLAPGGLPDPGRRAQHHRHQRLRARAGLERGVHQRDPARRRHGSRSSPKGSSPARRRLRTGWGRTKSVCTRWRRRSTSISTWSTCRRCRTRASGARRRSRSSRTSRTWISIRAQPATSPGRYSRPISPSWA